MLDVLGASENVPYNHMPDVTKMLPLKPCCAGAMLAGIASIGRRSVKSLILEYVNGLSDDPSAITVYDIAQGLMRFINKPYAKEYKSQPQKLRPVLELIVAGYNEKESDPKTYRVQFPEVKVRKALDDFGVAFGGQMQEIQRLVFGTDYYNMLRLEDRYKELLLRFAGEVKKLNSSVSLPDIAAFAQDNHIFGRVDSSSPEIWELISLDADWSNYSEQAAIDCVTFFVSVMIQAQRFNSRMPTVGGDIHTALISKTTGFEFVSQEGYRHGHHAQGGDKT